MKNHDFSISRIRPVHRWARYCAIDILPEVYELRDCQRDRCSGRKGDTNDSTDFTNTNPLSVQEGSKDGWEDYLESIIQDGIQSSGSQRKVIP